MSEEAEVQTEEVEQTSGAEEKARSMGWVPKEEFRGDPERWRPAEEFVERGENILPILKERNEKLTSDIAELKSTMSELREFYSKSEQRQYQQAIKDLKAKQKQAVEEGDTAAFDAIDKEISDLNEGAQETKKQQVSPAYEQWVSKNQWYLNDPEANAYADSVAEFLKRTKPGIVNTPTVFDEITKLVKEKFPEKFENPARKNVASVEGGSKGGQKKAARSYDTLPAEAKAQCKKFEKSIKGFKREEYVANFDWDGYEEARK